MHEIVTDKWESIDSGEEIKYSSVVNFQNWYVRFWFTVIIYKASIQAVARSKDKCTYVYMLSLCNFNIGELNKQFVALDDKEVYFRLWKQVGIATQLTEFSASSNSIDSIILGVYMLMYM